jgi:crotonobetainyl-CoA:carnitine CoA-transferase CaiB-like acyl-CoA transferase
MSQQVPLAGIRVIDFGRYIAGPYCGALLADMGADVIRIDRRQGSEDRYTVPLTDSGEGAGFLSLNRNKRSLTLDPGKPGAAEVIRRLVSGADVVIANLPVAVMAKMGIDYESLKAVQPRIILARISTFGPDGPYAHRLGFDTVAQAMSGAMSMTGFPDTPIRAIVPYCDYGTALHTAFGVMVALWEREKTGVGQIVDGSLLATGVTLMHAMLAERSVLGIERTQRGNAGIYAAPSDTWRTRDGWVLVATVGNDMFARWARMIGHPELIDDPDFRDDLARGDQYQRISALMEEWLSSLTTNEALERLAAARIPAGPVLSLGQVLEDPQVKARQLLQYVDYPGAPKPVPLANTAVRLSETPGGIRNRAPLHGEHTDEVLREIGFDETAIAELRASGAV